ncbi:hypothetical protein BaRGS_00024802 [Batillaria attramentaria]|uniref:Uncharacterized protein n=1 Tax=Batillaria attramentaria TaxID=370345 RepID=A0ABD0KA08_9CAEN
MPYTTARYGPTRLVCHGPTRQNCASRVRRETNLCVTGPLDRLVCPGSGRLTRAFWTHQSETCVRGPRDRDICVSASLRCPPDKFVRQGPTKP